MRLTWKYPRDLSDPQRQIVQEQLPPRKRLGRSPIDRRRILNAISYVVRSGCQWRMLPRTFPHWNTVYGVFGRWRRDGTWQRIHDALRTKVRRAAGKKPTPRRPSWTANRFARPQTERSATTTEPSESRAASGIWSDTLDLVLEVVVHGGYWQDHDGAYFVLTRLKQQFRRLKVLFGDAAYGLNELPVWVRKTFGCALQSAKKRVGVRGFQVLPKR